jgi:hypothetical protein
MNGHMLSKRSGIGQRRNLSSTLVLVIPNACSLQNSNRLHTENIIKPAALAKDVAECCHFNAGVYQIIYYTHSIDMCGRYIVLKKNLIWQHLVKIAFADVGLSGAICILFAIKRSHTNENGQESIIKLT